MAYCKVEKQHLLEMRTNASERLFSELRTDKEYFNAVTSSTGTNASIKKQFVKANLIVEELFHAGSA